MESNGDGSIFVGWRMSIASKRAKERQKRTPDELVTVKTVKHGRLKCQGPDIRGFGRISGADLQNRSRKCTPGAGCPAWGPDVRPLARMSGPMIPDRDLEFATRFGAEIDDFGGKIGEISWMKSGETWGDARSSRNQANPWIKINKTSSNQQITKKN